MTSEPGSLRALLHAALARPDELGPSDLAALEAALAPARVGVAELATLAAVLYTRPQLLTPVLVDRLYECVRTPILPTPVVPALQRVLEYVAVTPLGGLAGRRLLEALRRENAHPAALARLVPLLRYYVQWRAGVVELDTALELAALPHLAEHRGFLLDYVVERLAFETPDAFDTGAVDRLTTLFAGAPRLRYVLDAVAGRTAAPALVRERLGQLLAQQFPWRSLGDAVLRNRPVDVLAVLNVRVGQGDELTRLAPLLQALLDTNPAARVTVITPRPYLYDAPRVQAVPIADADGVASALRRRFDVVIDIEQPRLADVSIDPALEARVEALLRATPPRLVIRGDVGYNHFTYQQATIDGHELARALALDRPLVEGIYEPCLRLTAELGLWQRAGTEAPRTASLLVGTPSAEAAALWARLVRRAPGDSERVRPVALVNPFGGHARIKGFVERQVGTLATELAGLVREGYRVVLLPNGTPWVTSAYLAAIEARLPPAARPWVAIAPDPAETNPARRVSHAERPDLSYADGVMRLFKYFATYADLVCTVEGWLGHLAYDVGRPFRLVMMAQSHSFDWHPHGRSRAQQLVTRLSPLGPRYERTERLGERRPPPLPGRPRKAMLELALAGLGLAPGMGSERLLLRAAGSDDHDLRAAALAALGRVRPLAPFKAELLAALRDPEPVVRLRAAEALLDAGVDCRHELGGRADDLLRAHCDVARQRWQRVLALGPLALPVLATAVTDANVVIRREARWAAGRILAPWVRPRPSAVPPGRS